MATHRISIFGQLGPDESGRAFFEPYSVKATNDLFRHFVGIFNDPAASETHGFYFQFPVPKNYVGSPALILVYTTTVTTGNARMRCRYRAVGGDDTESLDQSSYQETVGFSTAAAPSAAHERKELSLSLTAANLAVDDAVAGILDRGDDSAADTMAAALILHDFLFEYADA